MKNRVLICLALLMLFVAGPVPAARAASPTFADLAVFMAKRYFRNEVPSGASVGDCVSFLNRQGVCFSLFDLLDPKVKVTKDDFARVIGQSTLVFLGEARIVNGCVQKPLEVDTWVDYCILNDVNFDFLWSNFLKRMEKGSLPEVKLFFGNQFAGEKNE